jgi:hypothetical protein
MKLDFSTFQKISLLSLVALATACGGGPNPDRDALNNISGDQKISGQKFSVLSSEEMLNFGDGTLSGSGSVRFVNDLGSVATAFNYVLSFSLSDSGELSLLSHVNPSLYNGLEIVFKRAGSVLLVSASAGNVTDDWSGFFVGIDASQPLRIAVDVHNNEALTHVVIWNDLVSSQSPIFDSGKDIDGAPGNGYGQNWGLKLKSATVTSVERNEARYAH